MLCGIPGKKLRVGIINQTVHNIRGVEKTKEFMKEQTLLWFGHNERIEETSLVKAKKVL